MPENRQNERCRKCGENPGTVSVEFRTSVGWYCWECYTDATKGVIKDIREQMRRDEEDD